MADLFEGAGDAGGARANQPETPAPGFALHRGCLDRAGQRALSEEVARLVAVAPLRRPLTPWGKPMSVGMTSAGALGWVTDRGGYRYEPRHPDTQLPWPAIPERLLELWSALTDDAPPPDSCLINHYRDKARMGLHQDKDELNFGVPVVSVSLGEPAKFRIGGLARKDPTMSLWLRSGDVLVMGGEGRLAFHGVDRIAVGEDALLNDMPAFGGGRINLTLRRAR